MDDATWTLNQTIRDQACTLVGHMMLPPLLPPAIPSQQPDPADPRRSSGGPVALLRPALYGSHATGNALSHEERSMLAGLPTRPQVHAAQRRPASPSIATLESELATTQEGLSVSPHWVISAISQCNRHVCFTQKRTQPQNKGSAVDRGVPDACVICHAAAAQIRQATSSSGRDKISTARITGDAERAS